MSTYAQALRERELAKRNQQTKLAPEVTKTPEEIAAEAEAAALKLAADKLSDDGIIDSELEIESFEAISKRTKESLEDELKKLRDKEAEKRIKHKKQMEENQKLFEAERAQILAENEAYKKEAEELRTLKAQKIEDTITAEDKLKTREKALEELQSSNKLLMSKLEGIERDRKEREDREKADKDLKDQVVRRRYEDELKSIPEDKQKYAERIFKGHDNLEEGLYAVLEAKRDGIFGKKKIEVIHKPTNTQTSQVDNTDSNKKLTSRDKIKRGIASKLKDGLKQGRL